MNAPPTSDDHCSPRTDYAVVLAGFLMQMLVQVIFQQLVASRYGSQETTDAYFNAAVLPLNLSTAIAGTLGPVVITLLGSKARMDDPVSFVTTIFAGSLMICLALAIIGSFLSLSLISRLYPALEPDQLGETARLFRILVWLLPLNVAIGLLQAILNSSRNFIVPAIAGTLGPLSMVIVIWWFKSHQTMIVAWGVLIGALVNVLIQLPWCLPKMRWPTGISRSHIQTTIRLGIPILTGMLILKIDPVVDKHVLSLLGDEGVTSQQNWAFLFTMSFLSVASGALSTVTFPRIASKVQRGSDELGKEVSDGLGMLMLLCLPAFTAIVVFSEFIIRDLLERGEFLPEDTLAVARIMKWYAPWIIGAALGELSGKTLISLKDSVTPNLIGCGFLCLGFVLKFLFVKSGGAEALAAITALISLSAGFVQIGTVAARIGPYRLLPAWYSFFPAVFGSLAAAITGWGILRTGIPCSGLVGLAAGGVVYFVFLGIVGAPGVQQLFGRFIPKRHVGKSETR